MKIWLVLISKQGGYRVHSAHTIEATAKEWAKCKEADGESTSIAELGPDEIQTICEAQDDTK